MSHSFPVPLAYIFPFILIFAIHHFSNYGMESIFTRLQHFINKFTS
ncbi:hypothetical protein SAMN05216365_15515 [Porphyromonadaceae bacterium NLAE-zl-C104]|nr:hypothetical protein SAMN05216331_13920 [Porphyromonadaceae bacterium KH3R12]SFT07172.1 hypothetical protein SAMN05216365_15515 [Porphyromonadaceae bacterium NLAE-zl-C104]